MSEYDGSVKINTKIDTDGFYLGIKKMSASTMQLKNSIKQAEDQASQLKREIKSLKKEKAEPKAVTALKDKMEQTQQEAEDLRVRLEQLSNTEVHTEGYEYMSDSLNRARNRLNQLQDRQKKMKATGVEESSKAWKNLEYDISQVRREIDFTTDNMKDMRMSGEAFQSATVTNQYTQLEAKLQSLVAKQDQYNAKLRETESREKQLKADKLAAKRAALEKLNEKLSVYNRRLEEAKKKESGFGANIKQLKSLSASLGKVTLGGNGAIGALSGLSNIASTLAGRMKGLILSAFVFNAISKGAGKLRDYLLECLSVNEDYNNSLKQIRGNLVTAFYPIYTYVLPAVNTLMSVLNKASGTLAAFSAKLFGGTLSQNQQGAKNLLQQAAAIKNVGKAADEAKGSLSDIDDMHILTDDKTDSDSSSAAVMENYSFGTIETDDKLLAWLDHMKEKFEPLINAISRVVKAAEPLAGPFLKGFIDGLTDIITNETVVGLINKIADALENMSPEEAEALGKAFGNMAAGFLVISGIIGTVIAIGSLISLLAGSTVALGIVSGILTAIAGWKIGNWIYELITGEKVDMTMWEQLDEIFSALLFDSEEFFNGLGWLIYDAAKAFLSNFGINAPTWEEYKKGVAEGFEIFKNAFEENGVAGVAEKVSDLIAYRLGIDSDTWKSVKQAAADTLDKYKTAFQNGGITGIVNQAWADIKNSTAGLSTYMGNMFSNIVSNIKAKFTNIGTSVGTSVSDSFASAVNGIFSRIESTINGFINKINAMRLVINKIPGVNLSRIETISLPRLATGTVVPANYGEFRAILGDNKREPEIVSPLSTMKQAVREELNANGGGGRIIRVYETINIDGKTVYETVKEYNDAEIDRTGKNPLMN